MSNSANPVLFRTDDGVDLAGLRCLPSRQPIGAIAMIHGFGEHTGRYQPLHRALTAAGFALAAADLRGFGHSPGARGHIERWDDYRCDAAAIVAQAALLAPGQPVFLFGHSMGGQITPRLIGKVPEKVSAAIITSTIGYFGNRTKEEQEEFVRKRTAPPPPGTDPIEAQRMVVNSMLGPTSAGPEVDLVRHFASNTPPKSVQAAVKAVQAYPEADAVAAIKAIKVPVLLVR